MSKHALLVAVPVKGSLHPALKERACELANAMLADARNRNLFHMRLAWHEDDGPVEPQPGRWGRQAWARNELLARYLGSGTDYVLWVDADLVDYPSDLPAQLYEANRGGVTAPMVLIEGSDQFYDTLGFIEDGCRLHYMPPYFRNQNGSDLIELDSVGCVYLAPASVLRQVAYASISPDWDRDSAGVYFAGGHTDHWPIMQAAKDMGLRVCCLTTVRARHANLPDYEGERWH